MLACRWSSESDPSRHLMQVRLALSKHAFTAVRVLARCSVAFKNCLVNTTERQQKKHKTKQASSSKKTAHASMTSTVACAGAADCLKLVSTEQVALHIGTDDAAFTFDHVAGPHTTQAQFFRGMHQRRQAVLKQLMMVCLALLIT